MNHFELFKNQQ